MKEVTTMEEMNTLKAIEKRLGEIYDLFMIGAESAPKSDLGSSDITLIADSIGSIHTEIRALLCDIQGMRGGEFSDGYHTFNELYHHRAALFATLCHICQPISWISKRHADGTMYPGMFIAGINTPKGQATYHIELEDWHLFAGIKEHPTAPAFDGHTPDDVIERIAGLDNVFSILRQYITDRELKVILNSRYGLPNLYPFANTRCNVCSHEICKDHNYANRDSSLFGFSIAHKKEDLMGFFEGDDILVHLGIARPDDYVIAATTETDGKGKRIVKSVDPMYCVGRCIGVSVDYQSCTHCISAIDIRTGRVVRLQYYEYAIIEDSCIDHDP